MNTVDLNKFYNTEYPFDVIFNMIQNNQRIQLDNRIIMITFKRNNQIIKVRDIDKSSKEKLRKEIRIRKPTIIDIGQFYDNFKDIGGSIFLTKNMKEFVFDIDINDFDVDENKDKLLLFKAFNIINNNNDSKFKSLRICDCIGDKKVCKECWYLIGSSALVIKFFMEYLFQIKNFLWIYSGNRGIHCWINNRELNMLNSEARKSFLKSISFPSDESLLELLSEENNMIMDLFKQLNIYFNEYILLNPTIFQKLKPLILEFINSYYPLIYDKLNEIWKNDSNNLDNWNKFEKFSKSITQWKIKNKNIIQPHKFIIFRLLYPRFDENVNLLHHLLKLPFSIHSKTQNLSFPVKYEEIPFILDTKHKFKIEERLKLINNLF
jgi:DNA primase small subunit